MTQSVTNERDASRLAALSRFRGSRHLKRMMVLACTVSSVSWMSVAPADAVEASGTARIQCSAFTGAPKTNPGWVNTVSYSISGDQLSLNTPVGGESNEWHGTVDTNGHILLTGDGSGGGGAWVMHFTGKWRGAGGTQLVGGYHNVRGMSGHRSCTISL